jgi:uncharacterized protein with HEPN domain
MWRDDDILIDIANAAQHILEFQTGFTRDAFLQDLRTQSAILHQLIIIGEATKRLSDEFRTLHAELPWTKIAGMRDYLVHVYHRVDLDQVWDTATNDIPDLLAKIQPLLPQKPPGS